MFLGKIAFHLAKHEAFKMEILNKPYLQDIVSYNSGNPYFKVGENEIQCFYLIHPSQRNLNISNGLWNLENETKLKDKVRI